MIAPRQASGTPVQTTPVQSTTEQSTSVGSATPLTSPSISAPGSFTTSNTRPSSFPNSVQTRGNDTGATIATYTYSNIPLNGTIAVPWASPIIPTIFTAGANVTAVGSEVLVYYTSTTITYNTVLPADTFQQASQITGVEIVSLSSLGVASKTSNPAEKQSKGHSGLSAGKVAGIAIATAVIGLGIGFFIHFMIAQRSKRRSEARQRRREVGYGRGAVSTRDYESEKTGLTSTQLEVDLDTLLPQSLDDTAVKRQAQNFFSQIDGHVENFYLNDNHNRQLPVGHTQTAAEFQAEPERRSFLMKRAICKSLLESISAHCSSDLSLLPYGYTTIARQLQDQDTNNHANALSWSRLRTSFIYLLRSDSTSEQNRLRAAAARIAENLNRDLQPFEDPRNSSLRTKDLDSLLLNSAAFGKMLLSQRAAWHFDWTTPTRSGARTAAQGPLVYFPAVVRLTDNRSKQLQSPIVVIQANILQ